MTAGRGIVHSEMPRQTNGLMWGFQLWVNLPARDKMMAPRYQDIPPSAIPEVVLADGVRARLIAGKAAGIRGPVDGIVTEPLYLDVTMAPGTHVSQPLTAGHTAFAYVYDGRATIGADDPREVVAPQLAVLGDGDRVRLTAGDGGARLLLLAARPLGEPVARYGPFVMNTREEILQAVEEFRRGALTH
jgi:redox-sensitive bicupin YhaK (pirin superfamily)